MKLQETKKVTFLELNEFNRDLLVEASKVYGLKNIQKLCAMREVTTFTDDTYESDYLEPWVQWVSVHTGVPSTVHGIKHLGDVPDLSSPQMWEVLSDRGVTSGVVGAMNAARKNAENCLFFLPDPWTHSETGYPDSLRQLLSLPRYISKNYLNLSSPRIMSEVKGLLAAISKIGVWSPLLGKIPKLSQNALRFRNEHFVFISFIDQLLTDIFVALRKKYAPDFSLLFLNSLAHTQHHHWVSFDYTNNRKLKLCLTNIDISLDKVFSSLGPGEQFYCCNGLSQMNTNHEKPWILYRQKDQADFLRELGIRFKKVEPHMTHDAHIFFSNHEDATHAVNILESARVSNKPLFLVETYHSEPCKVFYRVNFFDEVRSDESVVINEKQYRFLDYFKAIVRRTGRHIPRGTVFTNDPTLPEGIYNHELYHHILSVFGAASDSGSNRVGRSPDTRSQEAI